MKTQLLQDLNESGSANARPPSPETGKAPTPAPAPPSAPKARPAPAGPAVWHRPQRDQAAAPAPPPETTVPLPPSSPPRPRVAEPVRPPSPANQHATVQPRGFAPQPLPFGAQVPAQDAGGAGDPDWLTERLARDAAVHDRAEWNGSWTRRLASWGAAGVLLALLGAGGFWLYEQSRVEGALVVVANTNPAPSGAPRAAAPRALPTQPATAVLAPSGDMPVDTPPAPPPANAMGAPAAGDTAAAASVEPSPVAAVDIPAPVQTSRRMVKADAAPAKHKRSSAHKQPRTVASAAVRAEERSDERPDQRSYRQRYEETLMQCRAHGYDERQCLQRGCEMTRYGFACKG